MNRIAKYWATFALVIGMVYGAATAMRVIRGRGAVAKVYVEPVERSPVPVLPIDSFELTDSRNKPFGSADLRGKVWLGSFFFTNCPSSCRRLNQAIASLQSRFPDLEFVSITCDPSNDTPQVLAEYAALFGADTSRWHFLTGTLEYIQRVGADVFKLSVVKADHSTRAVLVGRDGAIVGHYQMLEESDVKQLADALPNALAIPAK